MIFKAIDYIFKARKGVKDTSGLVADISFGPLEGLFIISFIIFGFITLGLGFVAFRFESNTALIFSILFLLALIFDIWMFKKIKLFLEKVSNRAVDYSRKKYRSIKSNNIIDVDYE